MPVDNNPRINGSLYGWEILKELQRRHPHLKEARFINITTRPLTFNKLIGRIGDLLYTGSVGEATIFPLNPGLIPYGKVSMAICGADGDTIKDVEEELKKIFSTNKNS